MAKTETKPIKLYCVVAAWSEGGTSLVIEKTKKECFDKAHALYRADYKDYKEREELNDDYVNRWEFQKLLEGDMHSVDLCGTEDSMIYEYHERELEPSKPKSKSNPKSAEFVMPYCRANELGLIIHEEDCLDCVCCYEKGGVACCEEAKFPVNYLAKNGYLCPELDTDRLRKEMTPEEWNAFKHNMLVIEKEEIHEYIPVQRKS